MFKITNKKCSLITYLKKYKKIIVIEEQWKTGGMGSYILEMANKMKINLNLEIKSLNQRFFFENGGRDYLHRKFGLNIKKILLNI